MAHFRTWVKWGGPDEAAMPVGEWNEQEQMRLKAHAALDDLLRDMERRHVTPVSTRENQRKLELIINAGPE